MLKRKMRIMEISTRGATTIINALLLLSVLSAFCAGQEYLGTFPLRRCILRVNGIMGK
ncbi:hypothetical protein J7K55_01670 [Candidatus Aerophobetes bacterium]|nr:hypothetical protein [Candidatus Aerophobetes bacterium]